MVFLTSMCGITTLYAQGLYESYCPMHTIEEPEASANLMSSCNPSIDICVGKYKPAKGTLKTLMVFIRFEDDNTSMSYWNSYPNTNDIFDVESWMESSIDVSSSINSDNYFNVTNYFSVMSNDQFNVIGEAVYIELPPKDTFTDDGTPTGTPLAGLALMHATNKYALEYLDSRMDLSKYDNFEYDSIYHSEFK